jgi:hypothetical protein
MPILFGKKSLEKKFIKAHFWEIDNNHGFFSWNEIQ